MRPRTVLGSRPFQNPPSALSTYCRSLSALEIVLWCLLYMVALAGVLYHIEGPRLSDDSYQYLSEAENIGNGRGLSTSIVHFDVERASGRVPTPLTTFPPGYPLAIAALARTGLTTETAGVILSAASFVFLVPLMAWAAGLLELSVMATRIALVLLLGNAAAGAYATSVITESLFTAVSLGALVCLLRHERSNEGTSFAVAGNLLVGCAYWVRYAGLFLFVAAGAYLVWRACGRRDRRSVAASACLAVPAAMIACLMVRNTVLTGSWKGGNTKAVNHALVAVLKHFGVSMYHLLFGEGVATRLGPLQVTLGVGLLSLVVTATWAAGGSGFRAALGRAFPGAGQLLLYVVVYDAGMIYLGMFSVISFGSRMFYPLLPLYLLLAGLILTRVHALPGARSASLAWTACAAIIVGSYWSINLESTVSQRPRSPHLVVEASLAAPLGTGGRLRSWFDANVPLDAVVVATNGQATAHALKRKVVSLVGSEYSDRRWDEREVRTVMRRYGADFLILYPHLDPLVEPVQVESSFLRALIEGWRPQWLQLAAENSEVMIFRRSDNEVRGPQAAE